MLKNLYENQRKEQSLQRISKKTQGEYGSGQGIASILGIAIEELRQGFITILYM